jgi:hypothetical protein
VWDEACRRIHGYLPNNIIVNILGCHAYVILGNGKSFQSA